MTQQELDKTWSHFDSEGWRIWHKNGCKIYDSYCGSNAEIVLEGEAKKLQFNNIAYLRTVISELQELEDAWNFTLHEIDNVPHHHKADEIVNFIEDDLNDRKGLGIDDLEGSIKYEMLKSWKKRILHILCPNSYGK